MESQLRLTKVNVDLKVYTRGEYCSRNCPYFRDLKSIKHPDRLSAFCILDGNTTFPEWVDGGPEKSLYDSSFLRTKECLEGEIRYKSSQAPPAGTEY